MQLIRSLSTALLTLGLFVGSANATIITLNMSFTASSFEATAPYDPVTGNFSVSFDNTVNSIDASLISGSINIPVTGGLVFTYYQPTDFLIIGGALGGAESLLAGTDDFWLRIFSVSLTPTFLDLYYTSSLPNYDNFNDYYHSYSARLIASSVPEPSTLALLGSGILGLGVLRRRRKAKA